MISNIRRIKTNLKIQENSNPTKKSISSLGGTLFITGYSDSLDESVIVNASSNKKKSVPFFMTLIKTYDNKEIVRIIRNSEVI